MVQQPKRILAILISVFLLCGIMSVTASAAPPANPSSNASWDFTTVTANGSGTGWLWVQSTKTLTLANFTHTTSAMIALNLPDGATLVLNGTNEITSTYSGSNYSRGIAGNNLTITGSGRLYANSGSGTMSSSYGIAAVGNLIINGCTIIAKGGNGARGSNGVLVYENLTITNATVTATGGTATESSQGIYPWYGSLTINNSTVAATGGTANFTSYGIRADDSLVMITDSIVNATGGGGVAGFSYGIGVGNLTISGASITATGGTTNHKDGYWDDSIGIFANSLQMNSGTINATGGTAGCSYGISMDNFTVTGGTITATGGTALDDTSSGIHGDKLTINGGIVNTKGGNADFSYGFGLNELKISDGTVTATGGTANISSCGIGAFKLTISGGTITAIGNTSAISPDYIVPSGYRYWINTTPSATGASGPFTSNGTVAMVISSGHRYAKIETNIIPATYTLTLNANGGNVTPSSVTQAQGTTYTLPTPTPTPALNGYSFTGWTLSGGGSLNGNVYTFGTSNGTVTAGWTLNPVSYIATVNNGSGGGSYATNATVTITANAAPSGKVFDKWTTPDGVSFTNANATTTSFTMPAKNVTVTATYKDVPEQKNCIFNTSYEATLINWFMFIFLFGWLWMR